MAFLVDADAAKAVFNMPLSEGIFEGDTAAYLAKVGARRPILLLAFAPKAAGTFFRQAACSAVGGVLVRLVHAQGGRDGTPYLPYLLANYLNQGSETIVSHVHMQALAANRHLMAAFGMRPVIMLRNLADMLASFRDMLDSDPLARADGLNCQVPPNYLDFDDTEKADFLIDVFAPWYASYYATWKTLADEEPDTVCVLRYPDFCDDPQLALHQAVRHAGFDVSVGRCAAAVEETWAVRGRMRFNKGAAGRGRHYFSARHLERIERLLSYYPQLDEWQWDLLAAPAEARQAAVG